MRLNNWPVIGRNRRRKWRNGCGYRCAVSTTEAIPSSAVANTTRFMALPPIPKYNLISMNILCDSYIADKGDFSLGLRPIIKKWALGICRGREGTSSSITFCCAMAAADEGGERSGLSKRRLSAGDVPRKKPKMIVLAVQIAAARRIIDSQQALLERLRVNGQPTDQAEGALRTYVSSLPARAP